MDLFKHEFIIPFYFVHFLSSHSIDNIAITTFKLLSVKMTNFKKRS